MAIPKISLILDSGAFSAFTQKQEIDIVKYADFATKNQQHLSSIVNLDVIGPKDVEAAAQVSYDNSLYLKSRGLKVMPVLHSGEPVKFLDRMIEDFDWIGLSASMVSNAEAFKWYNLIFDYATDNDGYPLRKFHAFGDTVPQTLLSYPWYSADSTTWVISGGRAARIFVNGKAVQFRSRAAKDYAFITADDESMSRETWEEAFRKINLDPQKCITTQMRESDIMLIRNYVNAAHFLELQEKTRDVISYKGPKALMTTKKYRNGVPMTEPLNLHFAFTASTATRALAVLAHLHAKNLLISFYYITDKVWEEMVVPFLYDPVGTCLSNEKIRKEYDFLGQFMLKSEVIPT